MEIKEQKYGTHHIRGENCSDRQENKEEQKY